MSSAPLLSCSDLHRDYGDGRGLAPLSFQLEPGEVVLVRGPNGSGKTTLLECLGGLRSPSGGELRWRGGKRPSLGVLLQSESLKEGLTVGEFLSFHRAYEVDARPWSEWVAEWELAPLVPRRVESLSAGERGRVLLALAFSPRAALRLLDEPTTALDTVWQERWWGRVAQRSLAGDAFLIATHERGEAVPLPHRVLELGRPV